jgi:S1-C subfamily serine protease
LWLAVFILTLLQPLGALAQPGPPAKPEKAEMPATVHQRVAPVTVRIVCDSGAEFGSGTIIGITKQNRALILTCCHVVAKNFKESDPDIPLEFFANLNVRIAFEAKPMAASVLLNFVDRANDIAIISTADAISEERLTSYTLSDKVKPGQAVAAFGFPNTDEINQTVGNFNRMQGNYLVIDAALAPGNSGGPVVDKVGRMIGMSTYVEGKEGYAISMNLVSSVVNPWLQNLKLKKAWQLETDPTLLSRTYSDWRFIAGEVAIAGLAFWYFTQDDKQRQDLENPPSLP